MKILDALLKLLLVGVLAWVGLSLHNLSQVKIPSQLAVELTKPVAWELNQPVTVQAAQPLKVAGQLLVDVDRMPFGFGESIPVKLEQPVEVQFDNWTLKNLR